MLVLHADTYRNSLNNKDFLNSSAVHVGAMSAPHQPGSIVPRGPLRAVLPVHIRKRWDAIALPQLCEALLRESEEIELLRSDVRCADDLADSWREEALSLQQALAEMTGTECGITQSGSLVLVPASPCMAMGGE